MNYKQSLSLLLLFYTCLCAQSATNTLTSETLKIASEQTENSSLLASSHSLTTRSVAFDASTQQKLRAFFGSQLEKDKVEKPEQELYNRTIDASSIENEQKEMWQLWVDVNKESLEKSHFTDVLNGKNEFIWNLPAQQSMKATMFARGTKPDGGYPLFIALHGGGKGFVDGPWDLMDNTLAYEYYIKNAERDRNWFTLFFVPRMADDRIGRWYLQPQRMMIRRICRLAAVSDFVNPKKIYLYGASEGGYGTHRLALFMPDYFAGVSPIAACEPLKAPENVRNLPFLMYVGANDNGFGRSEYANIWKTKLAELKQQAPEDYEHSVNILPGQGHAISPYQHTGWLSQHEKRTYPKNISYLYYNMTHDYEEEAFSHGVYYLDFRDLKHDKKAEIRFDVEHQGNTFRITTTDPQGTKVQGSLGLFISEVDFNQPIEVYKEGKLVFKEMVKPSIGAMADALSLWCDPLRMFPAKITIPMTSNDKATAIESVNTNSLHETVRYNVAGMSIDKPEKGLNIVKMSDGTTRKELVR